MFRRSATVTLLAVSAAVAEIVKVAATWVEPTTVTPLTVMPPPVTVTPVPNSRLVPVRTT